MVNWNNYEEYMLLQVDGELNGAAQAALLAFIKEHPELEEELNAFQSAYFTPDTTMVFNNKESLLKPVPAGRVISLRHWRTLSAAAGIVLVCFAIGFLLNKNDGRMPVNEPLVVKQAPPQPVQIQVPEDIHTIEAETAKAPPRAKPLAAAKVQVTTAISQKERESETFTPLPIKPIAASLLAAADLPDALVMVPVQVEEVVIDEEAGRSAFLAWLPVRDEKKAALKHMSNSLEQTLAQAKNVRSNIKETSLALRWGSKEVVVNF